jgi:hypothetical protein
LEVSGRDIIAVYIYARATLAHHGRVSMGTNVHVGVGRVSIGDLLTAFNVHDMAIRDTHGVGRDTISDLGMGSRSINVGIVQVRVTRVEDGCCSRSVVRHS